MKNPADDEANWIIVTGGPWPDRHGLTGYIVPPLRDEYPWHGLGRDEVVVKIDYDPLGSPRYPEWSCVLSRKHVEHLGATSGDAA